MKKVTTVVLAALLAVGISALAFMANMGDKAFATGEYTDGNVDIQLVPSGEGGSTLIPGAKAQKTFKIENEGNNAAAWVWFSYAVPKALENGALKVKVNYNTQEWTPVDGVPRAGEHNNEYTEYTLLYNAPFNEQNASTSEITLTVSMASDIDIDENGNWIRVNNGVVENLDWNSNDAITVDVAAFAVQTDGSDDVSEAYNTYHVNLIQGGNTNN